MTAKVTPNINILLAEAMYNKLKVATNEETYYAAAAFPIDSDYYNYSNSFDSESEFFGGTDSDFGLDDQAFYFQNTSTLHRILPGGVSRVLPRVDWLKGRIYDAWPATTNYYVMVREFVSGIGRLNVYKCLFSPRKPSINAPTGSSATPITNADGYVWQYMYSISNSDAVRFLTNEYIPVPEKVTKEEAETLVSGTNRYLQYAVQENARIGSIYNFEIDSDTLKTSRDSDWQGGRIVTVRMKDSRSDSDAITQHFEGTVRYDSELNKFIPSLDQEGFGYQGLIKVIDQDGKLIPGLSAKIADGLGHGSNSTEDLNATDIMLVSRNVPQDNFLPLAQNQYQMCNLIRNPIDVSTNKVATQDFYVSCKSFTTDNISTFNINDIIAPYPSDNGRRGRIVAVDRDRIYYINHINDKEDNKFLDSEQISLDDGVNKIHTIKKITDREVIFNSGNFIVSDWKVSPLVRAKDQIESMNFILSF